jgi:hypothetical protein
MKLPARLTSSLLADRNDGSMAALSGDRRTIERERHKTGELTAEPWDLRPRWTRQT